MSASHRPFQFRRFTGLLLWCGALVVMVVVAVQPINRTALRLLFLLASCVVIGGGVYVSWPRKKWRWGWGIPAVFAFLFLLPGEGRVDLHRLNDRYIANVHAYQGTRYVWGGENGQGIDCSGLPRAALRRAMFVQGLKTANGYLLRSALSNWWFDASAKAMLEEYRGDTLRLGEAKSIARADHARLIQGDLAITDDGVHCLVYVGEQKWVQADPSAGKVIEVSADGENYWLKHAVEFVRWRVFSR